MVLGIILGTPPYHHISPTPSCAAEYMLESMVEDLHANDKDGSGDISQKEFKKIIRRSSARIHHVFLFAVDLLTHFDGDGVR